MFLMKGAINIIIALIVIANRLWNDYQGSNGLLTFTVPLDAPDSMYYYCANHAGMGGLIVIDSLGSLS